MGTQVWPANRRERDDWLGLAHGVLGHEDRSAPHRTRQPQVEIQPRLLGLAEGVGDSLLQCHGSPFLPGRFPPFLAELLPSGCTV
jgi:hypothetical protein